MTETTHSSSEHEGSAEMPSAGEEPILDASSGNENEPKRISWTAPDEADETIAEQADEQAGSPGAEEGGVFNGGVTSAGEEGGDMEGGAVGSDKTTSGKAQGEGDAANEKVAADSAPGPNGIFSQTEKPPEQGGFKIGIAGAKSAGKSYLFKALAYRLQNPETAGALAGFMKGSVVSLHQADRRDAKMLQWDLLAFLESYLRWQRLDPTKAFTQKWYRLSVPLNVGLLNRRKTFFHVEFFDGSGELLSSNNSEAKRTWEENYKDVNVMVFCLPFWAVFPKDPNQNLFDIEELLHFRQVVTTYGKLRKAFAITSRVKCILALTMADDADRSYLGSEIADSWLRPYGYGSVHEPDNDYFSQLRKPRMVNHYLANARRLSRALYGEIKATNRWVSDMLNEMDYGEGPPWIIPVSAMDGQFLDEMTSNPVHREQQGRLPQPQPAHVELPLLVALSQFCNILM